MVPALQAGAGESCKLLATFTLTILELVPLQSPEPLPA